MQHAIKLTLLVMLILPTMPLAAFEIEHEFSAEAIMVAPGKQAVHSKMYVSKKAVRTEFEKNNQLLVEVTLPGSGKRILMNPALKQYMVQSIPAEKNRGTGFDIEQQCAKDTALNCSVLGEEVVSGIKTVKWQFERRAEGRTYRSLHWVDKQRKMSLRDLLPDGTMAEMQKIAEMMVANRPLEKWQKMINHVDGSKSTVTQWYDKRLNMVVREEIEGGYFRELKNIREGKQDDALFTVPRDYQQINVPVTQENLPGRDR